MCRLTEKQSGRVSHRCGGECSQPWSSRGRSELRDRELLEPGGQRAECPGGTRGRPEGWPSPHRRAGARARCGGTCTFNWGRHWAWQTRGNEWSSPRGLGGRSQGGAGPAGTAARGTLTCGSAPHRTAASVLGGQGWGMSGAAHGLAWLPLSAQHSGSRVRPALKVPQVPGAAPSPPSPGSNALSAPALPRQGFGWKSSAVPGHRARAKGQADQEAHCLPTGVGARCLPCLGPPRPAQRGRRCCPRLRAACPRVDGSYRPDGGV